MEIISTILSYIGAYALRVGQFVDAMDQPTPIKMLVFILMIWGPLYAVALLLYGVLTLTERR